MMQRPALIRLALAALALVAVGCNPLPSRPEHAATDFTVIDPQLESELRAAAEDWARNGLEIAELVTINQSDAGIPVRFQPRTRLPAMCHEEHADGCADFEHGTFEGMWIASDLSPERRAVVLRHELVHFLVPDAEHLADEIPAVFSVHGTSLTITTGDLTHLGQYTTVTPAESR